MKLSIIKLPYEFPQDQLNCTISRFNELDNFTLIVFNLQGITILTVQMECQ